MESPTYTPPAGIESYPDNDGIVIDWERAEEVLGTLLEAQRDKHFPYYLDAARTPHEHDNLPESLSLGGIEHAMFLWTSCYYMRGGIKSYTAIKRLGDLYKEHPELFNCAEASLTAPDYITTTLQSFGLGFSATAIGEFWVENATRMERKWKGDPRKMFAGVNTYQECLERIKNDGKSSGFLGFQEKMVSMITYFLMDEEMIEPFNFPLPIDFHVLRVTIANEIIRFTDAKPGDNLLSQTTLEAMRYLYEKYAQAKGVTPLELCNAVWLLSQSLCGKQPGNITLEPNGPGGRKGRSTLLVPLAVKPDDIAQQKAYAASCGSCPLEPSCAWNIPSKPYYVQGILATRDNRRKLPPPNHQDALFDRKEL